jgi:hypothetical protein
MEHGVIILKRMAAATGRTLLFTGTAEKSRLVATQYIVFLLDQVSSSITMTYHFLIKINKIRLQLF